jgi:hypothetical protein
MELGLLAWGRHVGLAVLCMLSRLVLRFVLQGVP